MQKTKTSAITMRLERDDEASLKRAIAYLKDCLVSDIKRTEIDIEHFQNQVNRLKATQEIYNLRLRQLDNLINPHWDTVE